MFKDEEQCTCDSSSEKPIVIKYPCLFFFFPCAEMLTKFIVHDVLSASHLVTSVEGRHSPPVAEFEMVPC